MRQLGNMEADEVVRGEIMKDELSQRKSAGMPRNSLPLKKKQDSKRLRRMSLTLKKLCAGRSPISRDKLNPWLPSSHTPPTPPPPPLLTSAKPHHPRAEKLSRIFELVGQPH